MVSAVVTAAVFLTLFVFSAPPVSSFLLRTISLYDRYIYVC